MQIGKADGGKGGGSSSFSEKLRLLFSEAFRFGQDKQFRDEILKKVLVVGWTLSGFLFGVALLAQAVPVKNENCQTPYFPAPAALVDWGLILVVLASIVASAPLAITLHLRTDSNSTFARAVSAMLMDEMSSISIGYGALLLFYFIFSLSWKHAFAGLSMCIFGIALLLMATAMKKQNGATTGT